MPDLLSQTLERFLGASGGGLLQQGDKPFNSALGSSTLLSSTSSPSLAPQSDEGSHEHQQHFVVIPSRSVPRWLVPVGERGATVAGAQIYEPHRWGPRLLKGVFLSLLKAGGGDGRARACWWHRKDDLRCTISCIRLPANQILYLLCRSEGSLPCES